MIPCITCQAKLVCRVYEVVQQYHGDIAIGTCKYSNGHTMLSDVHRVRSPTEINDISDRIKRLSTKSEQPDIHIPGLEFEVGRLIISNKKFILSCTYITKSKSIV